MKLNMKDRLELSYQLKILEILYPEEKDYYANHRKAIEDGYELHYSWLTEHLSDGLTSEECTEVLDVLDMYSSLYYSLKTLESPKEITLDMIKFPGYDGNNETMQMAYTKYFIEDLGRFKCIKEMNKGYYNSHTRMIPKYKNMLAEWKRFPIGDRSTLNENQLLEIINTH